VDPECPIVSADAGCDADVPPEVAGQEAQIGCRAPYVVENATKCVAVGFEAAAGARSASGAALGRPVVARSKKVKFKDVRAGERRASFRLRLTKKGRQLLKADGELQVEVVVTVRNGRASRDVSRTIRFLGH
jgi:hypothetical protein